MELKNPLLAVTDMERSLAFYEAVLGLRVVLAGKPSPLAGTPPRSILKKTILTALRKG